MNVNIGNLTSTVRVVDGDALLTPQTLTRIVEAVLQALEERDRHHGQVRRERRIGDSMDECCHEGWN